MAAVKLITVTILCITLSSQTFSNSVKHQGNKASTNEPYRQKDDKDKIPKKPGVGCPLALINQMNGSYLYLVELCPSSKDNKRNKKSTKLDCPKIYMWTPEPHEITTGCCIPGIMCTDPITGLETETMGSKLKTVDFKVMELKANSRMNQYMRCKGDRDVSTPGHGVTRDGCVHCPGQNIKILSDQMVFAEVPGTTRKVYFRIFEFQIRIQGVAIDTFRYGQQVTPLDRLFDSSGRPFEVEFVGNVLSGMLHVIKDEELSGQIKEYFVQTLDDLETR